MEMSNEINKIYVWGQHTIRAGMRADPRYDEANDDYVRYAGSDDEIREQIAAIVSARYAAGTDLYMRRVARTLADAIGDDDPFAESEDDDA